MNRLDICTDKTLLVTYLYGECDEAARRVVDTHLAVCQACAAELLELRSTRGELADWEVPERALGFRIVSEQHATVADAPAPVPVRRSATLPWWLQTAAAVLLLSAGAGLAQIEVRYGSEGVVIRTGWSTAPAPAAASAAVDGRAAPWLGDLAALEERIRHDRSTASPSDVAAVPASGGAVDPESGAGSRDEALLRRVQALIDRSEQKQQRELAVRLADVVRDVDTQRRADQVRVQQTFGQLEGQTGVAVQQNRELLNYLVRVSQQR
jgi:anti-sigma factor RsiW